MWQRRVAGGEDGAGTPAACRRAYFRVSGLLPIRLTPIAPEAVEAAIFDLGMPDPLVQPIVDAEGDADSPLMARLRRIEEKLDLLLGASPIEVPRPLAGRDRKPVVFSGAGLSLEVPWSFRRGDAYKVEILLPPPHCRLVRAVAESVTDGEARPGAGRTRRLALRFRHIESEERDALVAYSYDLQRLELRARHVGEGARHA